MSGDDEDDIQLYRNETFEFNGNVFEVEIKAHENILMVQVESCDTMDQWCGKYDASYIEELTHKTGNYKQFNIFCNMLESAISQNSDSVSLNLLTYDDLKVLREQKLGGKILKRKHKPEDKLNTKRYLIMTYSVEFDQIHYPLPLSYQPIDMASFQSRVKDLRLENQQLRNTLYSNTNNAQTFRNEMPSEKLYQENKLLKAELNNFRQNFQESELLPEQFTKELNVLKKIIKNLEAELAKERNKHQKMMNKKIQEYKNVLEELEEVKASERNLKARCRNLTSELAILKKNAHVSPFLSTTSTNRNSAKRNSTNRNSSNRNLSNNSSRNVNRTNRGISPMYARGRSRERPNSRDIPPRQRSSSAGSLRRTPSPGFKRFDPSAYVKEKARKEREASLNQSRRRTPSSSNRDRTPSYSRYSKPPTSGVKARPSSNSHSNRRRPSYSSDIDRNSNLTKRKTSNKRGKSSSFKRYSSASEYSDEETYRSNTSRTGNIKRISARKSSQTKNYTEDTGDEGAERSHSLGIADIDARLEALQKFMKDNLD